MGTTAAAGVVRLSHLSPCPNCAADNGVTARFCWSCEGPLLRKRLRPSDIEPPQPAVAEPAAEPTVPAAAPEPQRRADPEPSFFPMLPDEAAGFQTAANDHAEGEPAARSMRRRNSSRRVMIGAVCFASAVMALGTYLIGRSVTRSQESQLLAHVSSTAPAPDATPVPTAHVEPAAVRPAIEPVAAVPLPEIAAPRDGEVLTARASPKPAAAKPVNAKRRAVAPAAVEAPAPAPAEPASCAPQVVALGLCGASPR